MIKYGIMFYHVYVFASKTTSYQPICASLDSQTGHANIEPPNKNFSDYLANLSTWIWGSVATLDIKHYSISVLGLLLLLCTFFKNLSAISC